MLSAIIKNEGFKLTEGRAVRPERIFGEPGNEAHAARRDWAAFAVVILCGQDMLLSVSDAPAFTPRPGHRSVRVKACCPGLGETSVQVVGMVDDDDGMHKADILLSGDYFTLPRRRAHQLRLSVDVPPDAACGRYRGALRFFAHSMFGGEAEIKTLEFFVTVHDVLIPAVRERKFHFSLLQHLSNIARKHETPLFSDGHFQVVERYVKALAALGQKAVTVIVSEAPWSGQRSFNDTEYMSDLFEYGMVRVRKNHDGAFEYDYSVMERYVELCGAYGICDEIEIIGLAGIWMDEEKGWGKAAPDWPDGVRVRYFDEQSETYRYMSRYGEIADYIAALQDFLERKGWLAVARVMADEPADVGEYRRILDNLRRVAPKLRFKAAINHAGFVREFKDVVADFALILPVVSAEWDELNEARKAIAGRLTYYVCCSPPFPNMFICSPLAESRLIPLLARHMGMDGFLRWNFTAWPENPRERLAYRTGEWWSGDTCFVYPSKGGEPLLSLRYYALKRGLDDAALAAAVALLPDGQAILERVWDAILRQKDMGAWRYDAGADPSALYSADWADYEKARLLMLDALENA